VVNNGTLTFNRSNELVIAGNISGSGDLVQQGSGTTILAGNDTYAGHITINDGAVQVGQGTANSTAFTGLITNNKSLVFNSTNTDLVISATIEGGGELHHDGTGTTTLTGNNTYTGLTTVNGGTLNIGAGSSTGAVTINTGGTLGGGGTVRGDLINRGILAPGFSPGTLGVVGSATQTGNFIQTATGVFRVEIASATVFDRLNVAGTSTLDGSIEVLSFGGFTPSVGQTFTVLTSAGGVSGTFASLVENYAGLKIRAIYNPNDVTLLFELDVLDGLKPRAIRNSLTPNRIATAGGIDDAMLADPDYVALVTEVGALNDTQFAAALAALSPQSFERLWDNTKYNTVMLTHAVENRMQTLGDIEPSENFWMQAARRVSQSDRDDDLAATGYYSNGVIIGADTSFGSNFSGGDKLSVGAMFSYTNDKVDLGNGGKSTVNHYLPGIYARYAAGDAFVEGTAAWGYADYSNKRRITIGANERTAKSHTEAQDRTIGARAGYEFHMLEDAFRIAPYAGFQHTRQEIDGFTENGAGLANLSVHDMKAESTVSRLGLLMNSPTQFGDWVITPKLDLAWRHEFQQSRRDISANFGPAPFTVRSTLPAADAFEANFGFDVKITPRTTIYADVGTFWDGSKGHSEEYRIGVNFKF
jgi:outer membrane autotransporter protein